MTAATQCAGDTTVVRVRTENNSFLFPLPWCSMCPLLSLAIRVTIVSIITVSIRNWCTTKRIILFFFSVFSSFDCIVRWLDVFLFIAGNSTNC